jgi:sugar/nucleoside kinase (ribokinase family)
VLTPEPDREPVRSLEPSATISVADPVVLTVGRVNFDLYVAEPGVPIATASEYVASVGGSPANIAIFARRLGIPSAVLSATGADFSGRFVRAELERHGVNARWLSESPVGATSLALLATLAPDSGERQFYRHNPADTYVEPELVDDLPWQSLRAVVISADALAAGRMSRTAAKVATTAADRHLQVWWDLDLRPNSWPEPGRYAATVPAAVDERAVVVGTEEEFAAFFGLEEWDHDIFEAGIRDRGLTTVILKRGSRGATLFLDGNRAVEIPAQTVEPVCTVGAGDTTAGALVAARIAGQTWSQAMELAMQAAAWTVRQPYCSTGFPTTADLGIDPLRPAAEAGLR